MYDSTDRLIDEVTYSNKYPWDSLADGKGHSLELINPNYDNSLPQNWMVCKIEATPCKINSVFLDSNTNAADYNVKFFDSIIVYPNPTRRMFTIKYLNTNDVYSTVGLYNILGKKINILEQYSLFENSNYNTIILPDNIQNGTYYLLIERNELKKAKPIEIID